VENADSKLPRGDFTPCGVACPGGGRKNRLLQQIIHVAGKAIDREAGCELGVQKLQAQNCRMTDHRHDDESHRQQNGARRKCGGHGSAQCSNHNFPEIDVKSISVGMAI
jgi:hypothetical protein